MHHRSARSTRSIRSTRFCLVNQFQCAKSGKRCCVCIHNGYNNMCIAHSYRYRMMKALVITRVLDVHVYQVSSVCHIVWVALRRAGI